MLNVGLRVWPNVGLNVVVNVGLRVGNNNLPKNNGNEENDKGQIYVCM